MSSVAGLIPVTAKAVNVCAYCRVRKQRCDRTVPQCGRCSLKGRLCDYTPYKEPPRLEDVALEPLVITYDGCSHFDLSARGTMALLHAVTAVIESADDPESVARLAGIVSEMLHLADVNMSLALEEFGPCIQQWCPILPAGFLDRGRNHPSQEVPRRDEGDQPILWFGVWLVSRRPCANTQHTTHCHLYRALKQVLSLYQCSTRITIPILQLSMLIAIYETSNGMSIPAFQSVATSTSIIQLLEHSGEKNADSMATLEWIKPSLLMLDRIVCLTSSPCLPLAVPDSHAISQGISSTLAPEIPAHSTGTAVELAVSPRKLHIRSSVALATAPALTYISSLSSLCTYSSFPPPPPPQSPSSATPLPSHAYDTATSTLTSCIHALVSKPEPHTWLHCDAIALAFCTNILLQEWQLYYLICARKFPHISLVEQSQSEYEKVRLALKYARRMAWDMVRVAIHKIEGGELDTDGTREGKNEVENLPFAGLSAVVRAGVAVLETGELVGEEEVVGEGEVEGFKRVVKLFEGRWGVGRAWMGRVGGL